MMLVFARTRLELNRFRFSIVITSQNLKNDIQIEMSVFVADHKHVNPGHHKFQMLYFQNEALNLSIPSFA